MLLARPRVISSDAVQHNGTQRNEVSLTLKLKMGEGRLGYVTTGLTWYHESFYIHKFCEWFGSDALHLTALKNMILAEKGVAEETYVFIFTVGL